MYLSGLGAYYLKDGQPVSVLHVGDTMGFNVPGYSQIWLDNKQNGVTQYSGPFTLPMPLYTLLPRDAGVFQATVYELTPQGTKGKAIGADSIQVLTATTKVNCQQGSGDNISVQQFDNVCPAGWQPWIQFSSPTISQIPAPGYTPSAPPSSGGRLLPTGLPTPSAPSPTILFSTPSAPIDYGPIPTTDTGPQEAGVLGLSPLALLVIAGLGVGFLMKRR